MVIGNLIMALDLIIQPELIFWCGAQNALFLNLQLLYIGRLLL